MCQDTWEKMLNILSLAIATDLKLMSVERGLVTNSVGPLQGLQDKCPEERQDNSEHVSGESPGCIVKGKVNTMCVMFSLV